MTRALVVHHDIDLADQEVESLRRLGYDVEQCSGPTANTCPILNGGTCHLAAKADVLVYDVWASGDTDGSGDLISGLRQLHPSVPIVLTTPGIGYAWEPAADSGVVELQGQPTGARLHEAIQRAITGQQAITERARGIEARVRQPDRAGRAVYAKLWGMLGAVLVLSGLVALVYGRGAATLPRVPRSRR